MTFADSRFLVLLYFILFLLLIISSRIASNKKTHFVSHPVLHAVKDRGIFIIIVDFRKVEAFDEEKWF